MNKHHPFGPSRLWLLDMCMASHAAQTGIPDRDSAEAQEGRLLHAAVEVGGGDWALTDDQLALVERCRNVLRPYVTESSSVMYERRVELLGEDGEQINYGTADAVIISGQHGVVIDWKFGWSKIAPAWLNIQIANYCAAVMQEFDLTACRGVIYQPRTREPPTEYEFTDPAAIANSIKRIISAEERFRRAGVYEYTPGDHCGMCRAITTCTAVRCELGGPPADISGENALDAYQRARLSEKYSRATMTILRGLAEEGKAVGLGMKERVGNRMFADVMEAWRVAEENLGRAGVIESGALSLSVAKLEQHLTKRWRGQGVDREECREVFKEKFKQTLDRGGSKYELVRDAEGEQGL